MAAALVVLRTYKALSPRVLTQAIKSHFTQKKKKKKKVILHRSLKGLNINVFTKINFRSCFVNITV